MTIASGSAPTSGVHSSSGDVELEAGLRPPLDRTGSTRSRSSARTHRSYPIPSFVDGPPAPALTLSPIPSADAAAPALPPPEHAYTKDNATQSTFTYTSSTTASAQDPSHERLVFDYRVLSASMHAYRHIAIFRRFGRLSMANLLYYQRELEELDDALRGVDREEAGLHLSAASHPAAVESSGTGVDEALAALKESRHRLMRALRDIMPKYQEALLLQEQVFTSLDPPRAQDAHLLHAVSDTTAGAGGPSPASLFTEAHGDDLVALGLGGRDALEKLVGRLIPSLFPRRNPSVEDVRSRGVSSRDVASILSPFTRRVTRLVIAFVSSVAILFPMCILTFVGGMEVKLAVIIVFTAVLAAAVALGTRGRGESIPMIVAAYTAVLVVFVQGPGG